LQETVLAPDKQETREVVNSLTQRNAVIIGLSPIAEKDVRRHFYSDSCGSRRNEVECINAVTTLRILNSSSVISQHSKLITAFTGHHHGAVLTADAVFGYWIKRLGKELRAYSTR
jgi:hypothetical protein